MTVEGRALVTGAAARADTSHARRCRGASIACWSDRWRG